MWNRSEKQGRNEQGYLGTQLRSILYWQANWKWQSLEEAFPSLFHKNKLQVVFCSLEDIYFLGVKCEMLKDILIMSQQIVK